MKRNIAVLGEDPKDHTITATTHANLGTKSIPYSEHVPYTRMKRKITVLGEDSCDTTIKLCVSNLLRFVWTSDRQRNWKSLFAIGLGLFQWLARKNEIWKRPSLLDMDENDDLKFRSNNSFLHDNVD